MRKWVVLPLMTLAWLSAIPAVRAQQEDRPQAAPAEACSQIPCRKAVRRLELRDRGKTHIFNTALLPFLTPDGRLYLYPGESITLTFEKTADGGPVRPLLLKAYEPGDPVDSGIAPESLTFSFEQLAGKPDMFLFNDNRTGMVLKYDVVMFMVEENGNLKRLPTSSCPLPPGNAQASLPGAEHWPDPILMLILDHFRVMPATARLSCDE